MGFRHQRVQRLRRLLRQRSFRRSERAFVAEGAKVLEAAILADAPIEGIYVAPGAEDSEGATRVLVRARQEGVRVHPLAKGVLERIADTVTPQPILGVIGLLDVPLDEVAGEELLVVCVDVRDPGNLGAIVRSADAAGAGAVVCCSGSGDVYNPKAVRASAGSIFNVPIVLGLEPAEVLATLGRSGVRRLATVATGGEDYALADLSGPVALVLGNEAKGLSSELSGIDGELTIPIDGAAESLNVAMAATVLCFELARRRRTERLASPTMMR